MSMESLPFNRRVELWLRTAPRRFTQWYHKGFGRYQFNPDGIDVMNQDWDNLLILDACRYDTFSEVSNLPGKLEQRVSRASTSQEFMQANFGKRDLRDTVYVTAHPGIHKTNGVNPKFNAIIDVWKSEWDSELRTVPPSKVTAAAISASERYPNKRLLVHYMQPHYPFIGPTGQENFDYKSVPQKGQDEGQSEGIDAKFWNTVGTRINDVPEPVVREAYRENIEITLPHVHEFLKSVEGRTVVTADHGEMLNERLFPIPYRIYGHPPGHYVPELVNVPWHVFSNGPRRRIVAGDSGADIDEKSEIVKERLQDLGYT